MFQMNPTAPGISIFFSEQTERYFDKCYKSQELTADNRQVVQGDRSILIIFQSVNWKLGTLNPFSQLIGRRTIFLNYDFLQRPFWDVMDTVFITPVLDVATGLNIFHRYVFLRLAQG